MSAWPGEGAGRLPLSIRVVLVLFVLALPFHTYRFLQVGGSGLIRLDWLAGGLLCALVVIDLILSARTIRLGYVGSGILALCGIFLLSLTGLVMSYLSDLLRFMLFFIQVLVQILVVLAILNIADSRAALRILLKTWFFLAVGISLYALYQTLARNYGLPLAYLPVLNPGIDKIWQSGGTFGLFTRPSSVFAEPSFLGSFLLGPLLLLGYLHAASRSDSIIFRTRQRQMLALSVIGAAFILTFSLSAFLALALTLLTVVLMRLDRKVMLRALRTSGLVIVFLVVGIQVSGILDFVSAFERVSRISGSITSQGMEQVADGSFQAQWARNSTAIEIWWRRNPVTGLGFRRYEILSRTVQGPDWYGGKADVSMMHGLHLRVLVETGLIGLTALLIFWIGTVRTLRRRARELLPRAEGTLLQAISIALLGFFFFSIFRGGLARPELWTLLAFAGLGLQMTASTGRGGGPGWISG